MSGVVVGFDLDMTLIDPRPGMVRVLTELSRETGFPLDGEYFAAHLGPPLGHVLAEQGVPEDRIPELVDRFRELYPAIVIPATVALPGAGAALAAVRRLGGKVLVVTGKFAQNAARHLTALDWTADALVGELWAGGKATALREHGARIYVGDHEGDMIGAVEAGAIGVGVTTGPCDEAQLRAAGAEFVLSELTGFPALLSELAGSGSGSGSVNSSSAASPAGSSSAD